MDTSNPAVIDSVSSRKSPTQVNRRHRSPELKRQIVEETLARADLQLRITNPMHRSNHDWKTEFTSFVLLRTTLAQPSSNFLDAQP
jgi:hypothetical protein